MPRRRLTPAQYRAAYRRAFAPVIRRGRAGKPASSTRLGSAAARMAAFARAFAGFDYRAAARERSREPKITIPAPSGIVVSETEVDDDFVGTFAFLFMVDGVEPGTFSIVSGPAWLTLVGNELRANGAQAAGTENVTLSVTDDEGRDFTSDPVALTVAATVSNTSGLEPASGTLDASEGFESEPITQSTSSGFKVTGKNGGEAAFLFDIGPPQAGWQYTMRYNPDWSQMKQEGRKAMVGMAIKQNDNFHLVGPRGDGRNPVTMLRSQAYGSFSKASQFNLSNDGQIAHGTKDGPNWVRLFVDWSGDYYLFQTSPDGVTWTDEYIESPALPIGRPVAGLQFGPGAFFAKSDNGVFSIAVEFWEAVAVTQEAAPAAAEDSEPVIYVVE